MSTSGRIHGEFLRLLFFLSDKQADDYFAALGCGAGTYSLAGAALCTNCEAGCRGGGEGQRGVFAEQYPALPPVSGLHRVGKVWAGVCAAAAGAVRKAPVATA